jgi:hypothetical protein
MTSPTVPRLRPIESDKIKLKYHVSDQVQDIRFVLPSEKLVLPIKLLQHIIHGRSVPIFYSVKKGYRVW